MSAQRLFTAIMATALVVPSRVIPYVWRIILTVGMLMAVTTVLPSKTRRPAFDALVVFST